MGGRGGSSNVKSMVPELPARIAFNASKKETSAPPNLKRDGVLEKAIKQNNDNAIESIKTHSEAGKALDYLIGRKIETSLKIKSLGTVEKLRKNPKLYQEYRAIGSLIEKARKKESSLRDNSDTGARNVENKTITTTYDRARKRRMSNFDAYWKASHGGK